MESELADAVTAMSAEGGTGIVLDVQHRRGRRHGLGADLQSQ